MGKAVRRLCAACDLPEDAFGPGTRATLMGRGAVLVEGQRGVVELSESCIRLRTAYGMLSIRGRELTLQALSTDMAIIRGTSVDSLEYPGQEEHACM